MNNKTKCKITFYWIIKFSDTGLKPFNSQMFIILILLMFVTLRNDVTRYWVFDLISISIFDGSVVFEHNSN